jgi:CheY-like chemotaxis protein/cytidylate kinase
MSVIAIFSASYCHAEEISGQVAEKLNYEFITTKRLLAETSAGFEVSEDKLERALHGSRSVFNRLTHERERNIASLRATLAELIKKDLVVFHGVAGHLLPKSLTHVLRVGLVAKNDFRISNAMKTDGISEKEAKKKIKKDDEERKQWSEHLFGLDFWDKSLYDIIIPMDSSSVERAVDEICENVAKPAIQTTPASQKAMDDFLLACQVYLALADQGHDVEVSARGGEITLTINRYVMRLESYGGELKKMVSKISGVKNVNTTIGPDFKQPDIYPKLDLPKKIMLVDDEKEFVHTLSERLQTRNLESVIAYDGEQALSMVEDDTPEVMVIDLKMPGIDGLEVLRRVKKKHPATEVIILTGHGSEKEEALAQELGAFAYLQKPIDIDVLSATMKDAYQKVAKAKDKDDDDN